MTPSVTPSRRVWPTRWVALLRDRLQFFRLLTLLVTLFALVGVAVAFGVRADRWWADTTLWASAALAGVWILGYRRQGLPAPGVPVEMGLLLAYMLGMPDDAGSYAVMFLALQHRALYGSRLGATALAFGYGVVLVTGELLLPPGASSRPLVIALELAVGGFTAYMMHTLAEILARDEERSRRVRASEERYRAMFEHNPWPMWLFDPADFRFVEVNQAAVRHYGYTREEFRAMTLHDIRLPEDRERLEAYRGIVSSDERISALARHCRKDRSLIDVEVTAHPVEFEARPLRLAVAVDVSARMAAERALRESEARFRSVANCLREAVLITDTQDRIILANERVRDVLGHEPDAVVGQLATELLLPATQRNAFRDRLRRRLDGESEQYEVELVRGDGVHIVAEVSASPYRDTTGAIIGTLGAISDITARKRLEERLAQSSRLEAVGQLAGGVAHDFNNLLTVIKCHAELVRDELGSTHVLQSSVREIERATDRASDVTGQLLAFSRKQLLQPRRLSVDDVVTEALPTLRKLAGPRVDIATSSDVSRPLAFADPTQLEHALVALVRNACDAMPRGGRITIGTETREVDAHDLALQNQHIPAGTYAVLTVADTGWGMNAGVLQRLFEPFFTTKEPGAGTGLGLASMFGIVRQSGGYVDVESVPGRGTTFVIYLPAQDDAAPVPALRELQTA